jgi:hypothetical protein
VPEGLPKISDIVIRFSGNSPDNDAGNDDGDDRVEESDVPALEVVSQQHFPKEQKRAGGERALIFLLLLDQIEINRCSQIFSKNWWLCFF